MRQRRRSVADMLAGPRPIAGGDGTLTKDQIDKIVGAHSAGIRLALEDAGEGQRPGKRRAIYPSDGRAHTDEPTSIGDAFVTSDAYRSWIERFPSGGPSGPGEYRSDPVEMRLSMRDASRPLNARSLLTTADTSGGALSDAQYVGLLAGGLVRPPKLRDLVAHIPVTSDQVEYVKGERPCRGRGSDSRGDRHERHDRTEAGRRHHLHQDHREHLHDRSLGSGHDTRRRRRAAGALTSTSTSTPTFRPSSRIRSSLATARGKTSPAS
jgi:hypothetical protein